MTAMKTNPLTLIIGAVLIIIFGLLLFVFQVRTTQVAIVTTFSKPTGGAITEPGAYFKLPWPIQKVYKFDKRIQSFEDQFTEDNTADQMTLMTMVYVGWRITDPKAFFPRFPGGSVTDAQRMLEAMTVSAKRAVVNRHPLADFINPSEPQSRFADIEQEIKSHLQAQIATNNYGIEIAFLGIKKLGLPESVTSAVFARMTSERNVLSEALEREGEKEASEIRVAADRQAAELLANADGEATRIRSLGEAEAARSLPVFEKNPALATFLFRLNALEQSLKEHTTLVLDTRIPPLDLFSFQGISTNSASR